MSGSFRNIMRIGDMSGQEPPEKKILSIGVSPDGFVFAILDSLDSRYLLLEDFEYSSGGFSEGYFNQLMHVVEGHPALSAPFEKVNISFFSPGLLLIPVELFREDDKEFLCRFCSTIPENHSVYSEKLNNLDAYGVYFMPQDLKTFLDTRFVSYSLRHQGAALIDNTLAFKHLEILPVDVVLHVKRSFFEIVLLDKHKVILYQSFKYQTFDDLLYYLFYVLEQFKRDAGNQKLILIGEISKDCNSYQTLSSLFRIVSFPERNNAYRYAGPFDQIPGHYYYNLLNLATCE